MSYFLARFISSITSSGMFCLVLTYWWSSVETVRKGQDFWRLGWQCLTSLQGFYLASPPQGTFAWFLLIDGLQSRQWGKAKIFEEMVRVSRAHLDLLSAHLLNHWLLLQQSDVHSCNPRAPCLNYNSPSSFLRPTRCVNLEENGT